MEPLFEVGEKVRVTEREFESWEYKFEYTGEMCDRFEGKIVTIKQVYPNTSDAEHEVEDDCAAYHIEEDDGRFTWSSGMFDKIPQQYFSEKNVTDKNKDIHKKVRNALYASLKEQGIDIY